MPLAQVRLHEVHDLVAAAVEDCAQHVETEAARMRELASTHVELGLLGPEARQALNVDPYPYGVKSNLKVLQMLAEYSHGQGLAPRVMQLGEVLAPSTLDR